MEFLKVEYLYLMLIPALLFYYLIVTKKSGVREFFAKDILKKLKFDNNTLGLEGRNIFLFLALFCMIIALSRPVGDKKETTITPSAYDIVVGIDISKSMRADDLYPNRLLFAKEKFKKLLEEFKEANIGVIAFSNSAFLVSPITSDFSSLKYLVDNLDMDSLSTKGTDFIPPIETANKFLQKNSQKILLLFTDGGDMDDFTTQIERAKEYGINIYVYALGDTKGATIKEEGQLLKDRHNNIVITKLNESIQNLAIETNGAYVKASTSDEGLRLLINDIKHKFKKTKKRAQKIINYNEFFYIPLTLATIFLLISFSSLPKFKNRANLILIFIIFSFYSPKANAIFLDFKDIKEANRAYESADYKNAIKNYTKVVDSKKSSESYYNLANSYYKNRNYKKAIETYSKVITDNSELEFKKLHNMANSYVYQQDYKNALRLYEDALKIKNDKDTIFNRDLAKKLLENREKQNKQNSDKNNKDDKKNQNQDKNKENSKNNQKNKKDEKGKDKEKKENQKSKDEEKTKQNNQNSSNQNKNQNAKKNQTDKKDMKSNEKNEEELFLSDIEEKKWDRKLQNQKPKTKPILIKTRKSTQHENYW